MYYRYIRISIIYIKGPKVKFADHIMIFKKFLFNSKKLMIEFFDTI